MIFFKYSLTTCHSLWSVILVNLLSTYLDTKIIGNPIEPFISLSNTTYIFPFSVNALISGLSLLAPETKFNFILPI